VRALAWLSRFSVAFAITLAALALAGRYGMGAESGGAHNLGLAIGLSFMLAAALTGALYAAPALLLIGAISWFFQRQSAYRFLAASALCALPLVAVRFF